MIDPELDARLKRDCVHCGKLFTIRGPHEQLRKYCGRAHRKVRKLKRHHWRESWLAFIWAVGALLLFLPVAHAASTPKPTPAVTSMLCVNKVTSGIRDILTTNKTGQCRSNEIPISAQALIVQPSPSPAASASPVQGDPSPDPTATATPTAASGPSVVDADGNLVGNDPSNSDLNANDYTIVNREIGTTWVSLLVGTDGFADEATTGGYGTLQLFFTTTDCSGSAYLALGFGPASEAGPTTPFEPLIQGIDDGNSGDYVYNQILYYASQPYSTITAKSVEDFNDPTANPTNGCQVLSTSESWVAGVVATFNLGSLDLTPPFQIQ